jgi:ribosome recycling factor
MDEMIIEQARGDMEGVIEIVEEDLASVKTGRAKPSLVERVQVDVYQTKMPLIELAAISAPESNLLVVQPWDESIVEDIIKAISASDLNINPVLDGSLIRIVIPPLTEERRNDLIKLVFQKIESGRVLIRQVRQEAKKKIEGVKGEPGVSEDDVHRMMQELEKVTEEFIKKVEGMGQKKEGELRNI